MVNYIYWLLKRQVEKDKIIKVLEGIFLFALIILINSNKNML